MRNVSLSPENGTVEFNINSSHDDVSGICNVEDVAGSVSAGTSQLNHRVYSYSLGACLVLISELKN
ncbi:hypothetical protein ACOIPX_005704 [Salmonella enterica]